MKGRRGRLVTSAASFAQTPTCLDVANHQLGEFWAGNLCQPAEWPSQHNVLTRIGQQRLLNEVRLVDVGDVVGSIADANRLGEL